MQRVVSCEGVSSVQPALPPQGSGGGVGRQPSVSEVGLTRERRHCCLGAMWERPTGGFEAGEEGGGGDSGGVSGAGRPGGGGGAGVAAPSQ
jgi:hypothetical protein